MSVTPSSTPLSLVTISWRTVCFHHRPATHRPTTQVPRTGRRVQRQRRACVVQQSAQVHRAARPLKRPQRRQRERSAQVHRAPIAGDRPRVAPRARHTQRAVRPHVHRAAGHLQIGQVQVSAVAGFQRPLVGEALTQRADRHARRVGEDLALVDDQHVARAAVPVVIADPPL